MKNKRTIASFVEVVIGVIMTLCGHFGLIDEYWSGMGTALVFVGFIMLVRQHRYKTNEEYKEKVDLDASDERNQYLRMKAWSWTGYLFVLISAFSSIILKIIGMDVYAIISGFAVCLLITLYWVSYIILRRKY